MSGGTVFDIGYQRYTGPREGRGRSRRAVFKDGIRLSLGLGRPPRAKVLPWFFITLLTVIGLVMSLIAGAVNKFVGPNASRAFGLPSHQDYYGIASIILFLFAAVVGPELLCRDRREGSLNLYLVRPLSASDYLWSRWSAFLVVMLLAVWLPQLILFLGLCLGDPSPVTYLGLHWLDIPRFLGAGLALAVYTTTLALLTASFTTRAAYASVFLIGLFLVTTPLTTGMAQEIGGTAGQWLSLMNLTNVPLHINDWLFGTPSSLTRSAPARAFGTRVLVLWFLLWTLLPAGVLWARYRKLAA